LLQKGLQLKRKQTLIPISIESKVYFSIPLQDRSEAGFWSLAIQE
jgi:hypothetical protein